MKAQVFDVDSGKQVIDINSGTSSKDAGDRNKAKPHDTNEANGSDADGNDEEAYVRAVCFSPDDRSLLAVMPQNTINMWDIETQEETVCLSGHQAEIYCVDYVDNVIASGGGDKYVRLWDPRQGKCTAVLGNGSESLEEGIASVSLSPNARFLAAACLDNVIRVWDTETQQLLKSLDGHSDSVFSIAFSADGKQVVSGSLDHTLRLWDLEQGGLNSLEGVASKRAASARKSSACSSTAFRGHEDFVVSVSFTGDNKYLLSGSKDRSVMFWDVRKNTNPVLTLRGHRNSVISVACSSRATKNPHASGVCSMFATGSGDNSACLWKYW